jgi:hypothetical protein
MNHKRRRPRTKVRCVLCTDNRDGNACKTDSTRGLKRRIHGKRGWKAEADFYLLQRKRPAAVDRPLPRR